MTDRYSRDWQLDDIHIVRSAAGGDGRTVEAYAAVFGVPAEIHDSHGDYVEEIVPTAFDRALAGGIDRVSVFYNHGMTMHGTPSGIGSVPIARPLEIRPDRRGLRTVSRFNRSQLADSVLESIRNGDIRGYSFRGPILRSDPQRVPRVSRGGLPLVRRLELGLTEYGPTPVPYYAGAAITAVRAGARRVDPTTFAEWLAEQGVRGDAVGEVARRFGFKADQGLSWLSRYVGRIAPRLVPALSRAAQEYAGTQRRWAAIPGASCCEEVDATWRRIRRSELTATIEGLRGFGFWGRQLDEYVEELRAAGKVHDPVTGEAASVPWDPDRDRWFAVLQRRAAEELADESGAAAMAARAAQAAVAELRELRRAESRAAKQGFERSCRQAGIRPVRTGR